MKNRMKSGFSNEFRMETNEFVTQMKTVFDLCDPKGLGYITVTSFLDLGHSYLGTHGKVRSKAVEVKAKVCENSNVHVNLGLSAQFPFGTIK